MCAINLHQTHCSMHTFQTTNQPTYLYAVV